MEMRLSIKTKVGRKGYIIIPKRIREAAGIEEGDEVLMEVRDGILIRPLKEVDLEELRRGLRIHAKRVKPFNVKLELGKLGSIRLEEEFDEGLY